ncbi:MAG: hypothetical protein NTZ55_04200 [Candidatus Roizmanbacteria bacterium]|nr:hypothetical protein [Candidatus Roizmanbacteria bacterium]
MTKELIHSIILVVCIALAFIFPQTPLAAYDIEIAAALFVILFVARRFSIFSKKTRLFESVAFTFIIVGVITTTGGLASPYFFLIHFLLFALTLLLEPLIPIIVTITLMLFFLLTMSGNASFMHLLPVFSLALMTPFALILGNEYEETKRLKKSLSNQQENTFLFLSLMLKNNLKEIQKSLDNFSGDHELSAIKRQVRTMDKLIDMFESKTSESND